MTNVFGLVAARAADAVGSDPYGCAIDVTYHSPDELPDSPSSLARAALDPAQVLKISAIAFARLADTATPSAYPPQPEADPASYNEQVVHVARRIFDRCPEADVVEATLWQANLRPRKLIDHEDGVKILRAGVLPRSQDTRGNVADQAAVAEAVSAETWTQRLRSQAEVARQLERLLLDLPSRLSPIDNDRRRREWQRHVEETASAAALPGRPLEPTAVLGAAQTTAVHTPAAELDQKLRTKDEAKDALDLIAGCLLQVGRDIDDPGALHGAGFRLASAPERLRSAREQGTPRFHGIGETLPESLESLSQLAARLLTVPPSPELRRALRQSSSYSQIDDQITALSRSQRARDGLQVQARLRRAGIASEIMVVSDPQPIEPWDNARVVVVVDDSDASQTTMAMQSWSSVDREAVGLVGRVVIVAEANGELSPTGLHFYGPTGAVLPLPPEDLAKIAAALNVPLRPEGDVARVAAMALEDLNRYSYERVRLARRCPDWYRPARDAPEPRQVEASIEAALPMACQRARSTSRWEDLDGDPHAQASAALLELCAVVASETGDGEGLAHQLADTDLTNLAREPEVETALHLAWLAHVLAASADGPLRLRTAAQSASRAPGQQEN
jgi:hypothetical protein